MKETGRETPNIYQKLYFSMFNAATDIMTVLEDWDIGRAREMLREIGGDEVSLLIVDGMDDYQKLCKTIYTAITKALEDLERMNIGSAKDRLRTAQQRTEEAYIASVAGDLPGEARQEAMENVCIVHDIHKDLAGRVDAARKEAGKEKAESSGDEN